MDKRATDLRYRRADRRSLQYAGKQGPRHQHESRWRLRWKDHGAVGTGGDGTQQKIQETGEDGFNTPGRVLDVWRATFSGSEDKERRHERWQTYGRRDGNGVGRWSLY